MKDFVETFKTDKVLQGKVADAVAKVAKDYGCTINEQPHVAADDQCRTLVCSLVCSF
ncbi:hypothetical protein BH11BAC7_BH11BAC7_25790 [soil metagenome]